jgi:hypothetical protein
MLISKRTSMAIFAGVRGTEVSLMASPRSRSRDAATKRRGRKQNEQNEQQLVKANPTKRKMSGWWYLGTMRLALSSLTAPLPLLRYGLTPGAGATDNFLAVDA